MLAQKFIKIITAVTLAEEFLLIINISFHTVGHIKSQRLLWSTVWWLQLQCVILFVRTAVNGRCLVGGEAGVDDTAGNTWSGVTVEQAGRVATPSQVVFVLVYLQQTVQPDLARYWSTIATVPTRHGRQPNFAALNRGRHLYSAGRPSRWALAHILVINCIIVMLHSFSFFCQCFYETLLSCSTRLNLYWCACFMAALYHIIYHHIFV